MSEILVWVKEPGKTVEQRMIGNDLKSLQEIVGGYIEDYSFASNFSVICNEEGKLLGLEPNVVMFGLEFVGTIIIAGMCCDEYDDFPVRHEGHMKALFPMLWED